MAYLSLRQLRIFVSVAHTGNLGRSADALFLTRGAASQAIKALEQQLGVELFERRAQRLVLNTQGRQLLPMAEELLAREQGVMTLFRSGVSATPLRLGASATIGNYLLPTLLARHWPDDWPLPVVTLANSYQLQQQLAERALDFALVESESIQAGLVRQPWRADEMVVVTPPDHALAGQTVPWQALEQQNWVLREVHSGSREQFDHHLAPRLNRFKVVLELGQLEAVVRAVQAGLGLSLVSRLACEAAIRQGWVGQVSLPHPIQRRFSLVHPPGSEHLPQLQRVLALLEEA
ncbi:LysR substrate-binding domain-containing protein [Ferrimonas balearica]|uniref:LysR substrate-binding domain-containing protein n=1 Tax=Ferrimonas balearica TaxID=44012 RepID=UPI001C55ADD7|nr:LysR substrate-binding domain-containing protein [Ferrimonas balearica]MBW3164746.1 LysR family transcriptional regulator [Ferrimonas balearica]